MHKILAEFKLVTPAFASGPVNQRPELRESAFKGVLAFWYRALALNRLGSVDRVREEEHRLFGSTSARGLFRIRISADVRENKPIGGYGVGYLGYGLFVRMGPPFHANRPSIPAGSKFLVHILFDNRASVHDVSLIRTALQVIGIFGGIGKRTRRGFGSLELCKLEDESLEQTYVLPSDYDGWNNLIQQLLPHVPMTGLPDYTAFSRNHSMVFLGSVIPDNANNMGWRTHEMVALDKIGREWLQYRSCGRENKAGLRVLPWGAAASGLFLASDHDVVHNLVSGKPVDSHPQRIAPGLPQNYFFSRTHINASVDGGVYRRRASPLFMRLLPVIGGFLPVYLYLPAQFLPAGAYIHMAGNGHKVDVKCSVNLATDKVIPNFLNSLKSCSQVYP